MREVQVDHAHHLHAGVPALGAARRAHAAPVRPAAAIAAAAGPEGDADNVATKLLNFPSSILVLK